MIPKNNFKSLHRKYYCLMLMIFKLYMSRVLCHFKTHSEDRLEARPLSLHLRDLSSCSFRIHKQLSVHTHSSYQGVGLWFPSEESTESISLRYCVKTIKNSLILKG